MAVRASSPPSLAMAGLHHRHVGCWPEASVSCDAMTCRLSGQSGRERAGFLFQVHCHMLRHACGYALANAGQVRAESKTGSGIVRYSILALICLPAGHKLETAKASETYLRHKRRARPPSRACRRVKGRQPSVPQPTAVPLGEFFSE